MAATSGSFRVNRRRGGVVALMVIAAAIDLVGSSKIVCAQICALNNVPNLCIAHHGKSFPDGSQLLFQHIGP